MKDERKEKGINGKKGSIKIQKMRVCVFVCVRDIERKKETKQIRTNKSDRNEI
jgi:hypothetical protein